MRPWSKILDKKTCHGYIMIGKTTDLCKVVCNEDDEGVVPLQGVDDLMSVEHLGSRGSLAAARRLFLQ